MGRRLDRLKSSGGKPGLIITPRHPGAIVGDRLHRDAPVDRTDQSTHVAADAGIDVHREPIGLGGRGSGRGQPPGDGRSIAADRLVAAVLAGDVAQAAVDALGLVDPGHDLDNSSRARPTF